ncbi:MAG: hypothetical protein HUU55_12650 [Myxococcales bacterium]|nr:hypothetical protein [Myxococcales bacterium]
MGTKFLIGAAIFIGSFGLGLGTTYLVVSRVGTESPIAAPPSVSGSESTWPAPAASRSEVTELSVPAPGKLAEVPEARVEVLQPQTVQPVVEASAERVPAEQPRIPEANKWWDAVVGKRCTIALDEVGFASLSLREGTVGNGDNTTFETSFANNRRLTVFKAAENPSVEVIALAFDDLGRPSVAHVRDPRSNASGVISLQVEGKQIRLIPQLAE